MSRRIPVYLLTGFLGSGKTTLLQAWLQQPELAGAALIVNELGEVGLDDRLMPSAVEATSLVANACVCCSGLPGLEQAMEDLFWDRLQRRMSPFPALVIETTGMAAPAPILAALQSEALLRERYRLAGVITTMSVTGGLEVLARHEEAQAQLRAAQVVVLTKVDRADPTRYQALHDRIRQLAPSAHALPSAQASLRAEQVLALLPGMGSDIPSWGGASGVRPAAVQLADSGASHGLHAAPGHPIPHHHHAEAVFMAMPERQSRSALWSQLRSLVRQGRTRILRIKGLVAVEGGDLVTVQWSPGDGEPEIAPFATAESACLPEDRALGLTVIRDGGQGS